VLSCTRAPGSGSFMGDFRQDGLPRKSASFRDVARANVVLRGEVLARHHCCGRVVLTDPILGELREPVDHHEISPDRKRLGLFDVVGTLVEDGRDIYCCHVVYLSG
jgi:hypothetical protein